MFGKLSELLAQTAAVGLALLLTGTLFAQTCLAAPVVGLDNRAWHHPCGTNKQTLNGPMKIPIRHPAMKAMKRVRTQIKLATEHFAKEKANIEMLHKEVAKEFGDSINYSWLPKKQVEWYEKSAKCLKKDARIAKILHELHSSLQKYLVTVHAVHNFTTHKHESREMANFRKRILGDVAKEIRKWLCEVETALLSSNQPIPDRESEDIIPRDDWNLWIRDPNHTTSLIQAWGVLSAYRKFATEWRNIFQTAIDPKLTPSNCTTYGKKAKTPKKQPANQSTTSRPASTRRPKKKQQAPKNQ